MFQTQLPSGRRRLLLFLIILFTIAVFGTRYLLLLLGWGEKQTDSTPKNQSEQTEPVVEQQENHSTTFTAEQLQQAKVVAEKFIKLYTQHDLSQSEEWFQSLESLLSPSYAEELRLEAEKIRPTQLVMKTEFHIIRRSICQPDGENVACHFEVSLKEIDALDQATLVDKNYEVILTLQNGNWMVEGLNIYGSFD